MFLNLQRSLFIICSMIAWSGFAQDSDELQWYCDDINERVGRGENDFGPFFRIEDTTFVVDIWDFTEVDEQGYAIGDVSIVEVIYIPFRDINQDKVDFDFADITTLTIRSLGAKFYTDTCPGQAEKGPDCGEYARKVQIRMNLIEHEWTAVWEQFLLLFEAAY